MAEIPAYHHVLFTIPVPLNRTIREHYCEPYFIKSVYSLVQFYYIQTTFLTTATANEPY